jgi:hypothetical protein
MFCNVQKLKILCFVSIVYMVGRFFALTTMHMFIVHAHSFMTDPNDTTHGVALELNLFNRKIRGSQDLP